MRYTVKCIYRNGVRLTDKAVENEIFYTGRVLIEEVSLKVPLGPYARRARLIDIDNLPPSYDFIGRLPTSYDIIRPLFKAEVFRSKNGHMMIKGFQIHVDDRTGDIQQHFQCWLLYPTENKQHTLPSIKTRTKVRKWILGRRKFIFP